MASGADLYGKGSQMKTTSDRDKDVALDFWFDMTQNLGNEENIVFISTNI